MKREMARQAKGFQVVTSKLGMCRQGLVRRNSCALLLVMLVMMLSGCGFHLRKSVVLPETLSTIYVQDDRASRITPVLQQLIKSNDTVMAKDAATAKALLTINSESFDKGVLSVSSTGKVQVYALRYNVQFSLLDKSRRPLISLQTIHLERDLRFDATAVLANSAEEAELNQDMLEDAAQQILRRIQYVKVNSD